MPRTTCLTPDELTALQLGDLPDAALDEVAAHLEVCRACETAAAALDRLTDTRLDPFRAGGRDMPRHAPLRAVGEHEILEEIGRGGMGIVYKARHKRLQRTVALKMLLGGAFADGNEKARFRGEAEAVARLQHPNIVQLFEVGEYDNGDGPPRTWFTLEFVDGGNLAERVEGRPQPPEQAAAWVETLAHAVHHAHEHDIIHRDLKPHNVLLTRAGQLKVCDFGVAKRLDAAGVRTESGMLVGTAEYMAPEQAVGAAVGPAADIHAAGAILYTLLTGRPPYQGTNVYDTLTQVRWQEPAPPSRLQPTVPRDLETVCLKCLEKEPARRYASAAALADDLHRFLAREPVLARPVGLLGRAAKWARRRPAVAALLATVAAVTLAGVGLVAWQWREAVYQRGQAEERADGETTANQLAQARERQEKEARRTAENLLAAALLDQGSTLCDRGETAQGLLWLARGLEVASRAGSAPLERAARMGLAGWKGRLIQPGPRLVHDQAARAVAFSPDGKLAATGSHDRTARLWDAATGKPRSEPLPHAHPVWVVAFSPDSKLLLTGSAGPDGKQGEARLWDTRTGKPLGAPLPLKDLFDDTDTGTGGRRLRVRQGDPTFAPFRAAAFSADGQTFLTATAAEVRLWKTANRQPVGPPLPHPGEILTAAFSPDGRTVLTCGTDGAARLWDAATGQPRIEPLPHRGPVEAAAFSPDGRVVATASWVPVKDAASGKTLIGGEVHLWRWETRELWGKPLPCGGRIQALAFGPDGRTVAAGAWQLARGWGSDGQFRLSGEARLWRAPADPDAVSTSWRLGFPPREEGAPVRTVALSPDGRLLLVGTDSSKVRFYAAASGSLLHAAQEPAGHVVAAAFRPDGRAALTALAGSKQEGTVRLWGLPAPPAGRPLEGPAGVVDVVHSGPGGKLFVTAGADGVARLWDAATGRQHGPALRHDGRIRAAAFSPDGRTLVTASEDRTARLWDTATGRQRDPVFAHPSAVSCVTFAPDGKTILTGTGGDDCKARLWDTATGRPVGEPLPGDRPLSLVAFSPDGRTVLAASASGVRCWRTDDRRPVRGLWFTPKQVRVPAAFSPDGRLLVGDDRGTVKVWDVAEARVVREWPSPEGLRGIEFSPDGTSVLLRFAVHSAQLWDVALGQPKTPPLFHRESEIWATAFSPDGRTVLTASGDGAVCLWDAATGKQLGPPLLHAVIVTGVAFEGDGRTLVTACEDGTVLLWPAPAEEAGAPDTLRRRTEALTGLRLDERGIIWRSGTASLP